MIKIGRVFPCRTSMSPLDKDVYFGLPELFTPKYDEIHLSVVFTWDKYKVEKLSYEWERFGKVRVGGVAYDDPGKEFIPGLYLKRGIVITSRGCPNNCSFCLVPNREGKIRELEIKEGNILQDNNILACSKNHLEKVFDMLKKQKEISFKGGLESSRVTTYIADRLSSLKIKELWLACDTDNSLKSLKRALEIFRSRGFNRNKLRCYVLAGHNEPITKSEERLKTVFEYGALPFIQVFQEANNKKRYAGELSRNDNYFVRNWSRPAIIKSIMSGG